MDTKTLVKKLQDLFLEKNKGEKKFSQIWLSEIDLGGLYYSDSYILRLKAAYTIKDFYNETREIIQLLNKKEKEISRYISRVSVYDINEKANPASDDTIILEESAEFIH